MPTSTRKMITIRPGQHQRCYSADVVEFRADGWVVLTGNVRVHLGDAKPDTTVYVRAGIIEVRPYDA